MENWDEIRTALYVAKLGTVSGAAEAMGVHHATVIRHIDALEKRLGAKLFQRHSRGYTPTESGRDLLDVAQTTQEQFAQLSNRIKGQGDKIAGELVVTSLEELAPQLSPVLTDFQAEHPDLSIRYLTGGRIFKLEYGEAHIAIRAARFGTRPEQPDNVVQPFIKISMRLMAAQSYISRHGLPQDESDLANHHFVGLAEGTTRAPFNEWLSELAAPNRIQYRVEGSAAYRHAILAGAGIGFVNRADAQADLIEVSPQKPHWSTELFLVTHVDLHRTNKVQAFLTYLKNRAKSW
jgi:DNA-binding transcriptional LysR family regulator